MKRDPLFIGTTEKVGKLIERAKRTNDERDKIDRAAGAATPADCGPVEEIQVAIQGLLAAMEKEDWNIVAESFLFLASAFRTLQSFTKGA